SGIDAGNSGGPLVDPKGQVRAIAGEMRAALMAVETRGRSSMRWALPGEYAARLIQGYPMEVKPGIPYLDSSVGKQPIEIEFGDPMKRVRKVALDFWVGNAGKPRKPSEEAPKPLDGDGNRQSVELRYDS